MPCLGVNLAVKCEKWVKLAIFGDSGAWKLVLRPRGAETPRVVAQATSIDGDSPFLVIFGPIFSGLQVDFGPISTLGGDSGGVWGRF